METTKPWYASNAVWASLIQMAVGVAVAMGVVNEVAGTTIIADGPDIAIGFVNGLLGAWSLYGRVRATAQVTA